MHSIKMKAAVAAVLLSGLLSTAAVLAFNAGDAPKDDPPAKPPAAKAANLPALAPARDATLRYQFREGDSFRYVVEKQLDMHTNVPGNGRRNTITQIYDVAWKVGSVDSDGNARVTLTLDRVRRTETDTNVPVAGALIEFDSKKHKNPQGSPNVVRILSPFLKAQVGAEFTCTISPLGEITDFKASKKMLDALNKPGIKEMESVEIFKQQIASQGSVILPKAPVAKGAGWSEKSEAPYAGGHAKVKFETKATYQGEKEHDGIKLAEISVQPTGSTIEKLPTSGIGPVVLKNHDGKGTILFDNGEGRLIHADFTQTIDMETGSPGQVVVWKAKLSISTKLVPAK